MARTPILISLLMILALSAIPAAAQTTTQFTHQGALSVPDGDYEFEFRLFDTPTVGTGAQHGASIQKLSPNTVHVINNEFTVLLDFGEAVFTGAELYLEIGWRPVGGSFSVVSTREKVTAAYANRSLSAATADTATNATQLGGLSVSNFIQNTAMPQASTSFNVSGDGTAGGTLSGNIVNAATQFNISGDRILSNPGNANLFVGSDAGLSNTTGEHNAFFGFTAGKSNRGGSSNSFFGRSAGRGNMTGGANAFFGAFAGISNTTGGFNSFFGATAGEFNMTGLDNTFIGSAAGFSNKTGSKNSMLGRNADLSDGLSNATAIGANAFVSQSNSLVLGSINGVNGALADILVGIGTTAPAAKLHVSGLGGIRARIDSDSNAGLALSLNNVPKWSVATVTGGQFQIFNDAIGLNAMAINSTNNNVGIGTTAPAAKLHVSGLGGIRARIDSDSNAGLALSLNNIPRWSVATVTGGQFVIFNDAIGLNAMAINSTNNNVGIGTTTPADLLHVAGGFLRLSILAGGGLVQLCLNTSSQVSICGSSLRYKTNLAPFSGGLNLVSRLQPITFNWKANGEADLGLGAEAVAEVEPLLVTHNDKGEVEGVKYDRIAVVLLNAIKEQQQQIQEQQAQIERQHHELESLKRLACLRQPKAGVCKAANGSTR